MERSESTCFLFNGDIDTHRKLRVNHYSPYLSDTEKTTGSVLLSFTKKSIKINALVLCVLKTSFELYVHLLDRHRHVGKLRVIATTRACLCAPGELVSWQQLGNLPDTLGTHNLNFQRL